MKQVVQAIRGGAVEVLDVPAPQIGPTEVLVRTAASIVSPGTERAVTALAQSGLVAKARARPDLVRQVVRRARTDGIGTAARAVQARLGGDIPLGYSAAGTVVDVGEMVSGAGIVPGQLVATGGAGWANHAEVQAVPGLLCAPVPAGVPAVDAAFATVGSIALHGLRLADVGPGAKVVVAGLGLVGQLAARIALASGCDVAGIDVADLPLAAAGRAGVLTLREQGEATTAAVLRWSRGRGADAVLVCAATRTSDLMGRVPALCRDRATVVVVGDVGLELNRTPFYDRELSVRFARSYGPGRYEQAYEDWGVDYPAGQVRWTEGRNLEAVVDLLATSRLEVADLVTHSFAIDDAAAAYALVESRSEPYLAIRFDYDVSRTLPDSIVLPSQRGHPSRLPGAQGLAGPARLPGFPRLSRSSRLSGSSRRPELPAVPGLAGAQRVTDEGTARASGGRYGVGWIGAGAFSATVLLPAFRAAGFDRFVTVGSAGGLRARRFGERAGFAKIAGSADAVIDDPDVDVVVIATPHDAHADLVVRALDAGRHVWCEKPLALSFDELQAVDAAARRADGVLFVGFNRRWSPAARLAREHLDARTSPLTMIYRVAAGKIADGHWYADRRQGGRLLGEVCHFVDTCTFLNPSEVVSVQAHPAGGGGVLVADDVTVVLGHADQSTSVIVYSSARPAGIGKEHLEALAGDTHLVLDDFRNLTVGGRGVWQGRQDKGHNAAVREFHRRLRNTGDAPEPDFGLATSAHVLAAAAAATATTTATPAAPATRSSAQPADRATPDSTSGADVATTPNAAT
ncbi:bi-domain-containing oxidoreductase [Protofrankia symbiont of Coriaria ruscifolia]|uniref:bi-domain-containing oxidoreductase n=1 Tax=Protofrankia symbiont of Coriaria ruscifolia TaxID=1306542 RepID=UPI0010410CFC|nr:bi-domain-containing oxidoreductase [Protofrankia symbiont of Coriaria ruscifolia]